MLRRLIKESCLSLRKLALMLLVRKPPGRQLSARPGSLLVISERRLGDVCLEIPILRRFRANYPDVFLAVVAPAGLHPLIEWSCRPDVLLDFDDTARLRGRSWDAAIDLTGDYHLKSAQLAASTGASVRVGFEYGGRGRYFNIPLPLRRAEHMAQTYERPFRALGLDLAGPVVTSPLPPLQGRGVRYSVGIHPGAHHETQRWPARYYAELARLLHSAGNTCVVFGTPGEQAIVREIAEKSGSAAAPAITHGVMELAAAIQNVDMLVCNNSGPLHLAGLLGVPTLSFMGPTIKEKWQPLASDAVVLRRDELPCIGCNMGYCRIRTHDCMIDITPEMAFAEYNRFKSRLSRGTSN